MAWISVHETVDGPKLRKLHKSLGCSKFEALGILNFFWFWGLQNADRQGLILCADEDDIARHLYGVGAGCRLAPDKLVPALIEAGFIDKDEDRLYIHDWESWQKEWYKYQERLKNDAERQRKKRNANKEAESPADNPADSPVDIPKKVDVAVPEQPKDTQPKDDGEKKKATRSAYTKDFEEFWEIYPRKVEKAKAASAYNARLKQGWSPAELLLAAKNYAATCKKNRTESQYIKHGATFLSANTPFVDYLPKEAQSVAEKKDDAQPDMSNPFGKFMGD